MVPGIGDQHRLLHTSYLPGKLHQVAQGPVCRQELMRLRSVDPGWDMLPQSFPVPRLQAGQVRRLPTLSVLERLR